VELNVLSRNLHNVWRLWPLHKPSKPIDYKLSSPGYRVLKKM